MLTLDEVKELRKQLIFKGKSQPGFSILKGKIPKNKHAKAKYCNPNDLDNSGSITEEDVVVLHGLVQQYKPKTILEIGTWFGTSAMVMEKAMDGNVKIYTCDKHKVYVYESANVIYKNMWSYDFMKWLKPQQVIFDFAFIDARMQGDEKTLLNMMSSEAAIFIHDFAKDMKGWKNVRAFQKLIPEIHVLSPSKGTALIDLRRRSAKKEANYE